MQWRGKSIKYYERDKDSEQLHGGDDKVIVSVGFKTALIRIKVIGNR